MVGFFLVFFSFSKVDSFKHMPRNCSYNHAKIAFDIPILEMQRVVQNELEITLLHIVIHSK
jgi:hypothetical protein